MTKAEEMRNLANEMKRLAEEAKMKAYNPIMEKIRSAAARGLMAISLYEDVPEIVNKRLKDEGFSLKYYNADPRERMSRGYTKISWE